MNLQLYAIVGVILLLLLAGLSLAAKGKIADSVKVEAKGEDFSQADLFVEIGPETKERLLDAWRWKVGEDAKVFRVTVFGDIFTETSGGRIYRLDTGRGDYSEVAGNTEQWAQALRLHGREWFHWNTLQKLRSLGAELKEGQVYSWRQEPMLGGAESVDNIDFISLEVHVSHAGRVAEAIKDIPPGTKIESHDFEVLGPGAAQKTTGEGGEDTTIYEVVINEELQYSMWPAREQLPAGWKSVGKSGTKQECLDYIKEVWTDMRPLSLRKKQERQ